MPEHFLDLERFINCHGENGIEIVSYTQQETIQGNTITNNTLNGILINSFTSIESNNWIGGFRTAGDLRLVGGLSDQGFTNIGPLGTSNTISNNGQDGIRVINSNENAIQTNIINSNDSDGISLINSSYNLVGGKFGGAATVTPPVLGNIIHTNDGFGVEVAQNNANATDNSILSNSIYENTNKGIAHVTL